jgi:hypothetical protein
MFDKSGIDAELTRSLGISTKEVKQLIAAGGDLAERRFMECCWCLWKVNGAN